VIGSKCMKIRIKTLAFMGEWKTENGLRYFEEHWGFSVVLAGRIWISVRSKTRF
jgi:hypothetical protein